MSAGAELSELSAGAAAANFATDGLSLALENLKHVGGDAGAVLNGLRDALSGMAHGNLVHAAESIHGVAEALANMSDEADRQERALAALGDAYDDVTRATNDTMDETDAFRLRQRLLEAGLQTTGAELATVAGFAREHGRALGMDATEATERLTGALISGSSRALRPFGIDIDRNASRADQFTSALRQMGEGLASTGVSARSAGEEIRLFDRELGDSINSLGREVAQLLHVREVAQGLTGLIRGDLLNGEADTNIREGRERNERRAQEQAAFRAAAGRGINLHGLNVGALSDSERATLAFALNDPTRGAGAAGQAYVDRYVAAQQATTLRRQQEEALDAAYAQSDRDAAANDLGQDRGARHGGGGGAARDPEEERLRHVAQAHARLHEMDRANARERLQAEEHFAHEKTELLHAQMLREKDIINQMMDANQALIRQQDEVAAAHRRANDVGLQMSEQFRASLHLNETSAKRFADFATSAYNSVTAALEQHIAALIEGNESGEQAARAFTHTISMQIGLQAGKEAVFELAKGLSMVARAAAAEGADPGADTSAAMHFAAAAAYAGLAGIGLATAYATNAPRASGHGGAPGVPSMAARANGPANDNAYGGGNTYLTVNVNGSVIDAQGMGVATAMGLRELHGSQQLPAPWRTAAMSWGRAA